MDTSSLSIHAMWHMALERLVPLKERGGPARTRAQALLASRVLMLLLSLASFPFVLVLCGLPHGVDHLAAAMLVLPALVVLALKCGAPAERVHAVSVLASLAGLGVLAWVSGPFMPALIALSFLVLAESIHTLKGPALIGACVVACAFTAVLAAAGQTGLLPPATTAGYVPLVVVSLAGSCFVYMMEARSAPQNEQALRTTTVPAALRHAADMLTVHTRNANVVYASPYAQQAFGLSLDGPASDGFFERVHVQDRPAFLHCFDEAARTGKPATLCFRMRAPQADAETHWLNVELRAQAAPADKANAPLEIVAVTRVLDKPVAQAAAAGAPNEPEERFSLARTQFLAHVSHELRTPLNAIIGFSEVMGQSNFQKFGIGRYVEYAALIHDSGKHLLDIVNAILDMSKLEAGAFEIVVEPFQPSDLIDKVMASLEPLAVKAQVQLKKTGDTVLPEMIADPRACRQILVNLLSNAIKFSNPGGRVCVGARSKDDSITFSVSDTGIGIASEDIPRLGTPFVQAHSSYDRRFEGTGLGLSLVKGFAKLHNGSLRIDSTLGKGTCVGVTLPRSPHIPSDQAIQNLRRVQSEMSQFAQAGIETRTQQA